jgi:hypothetical protein
MPIELPTGDGDGRTHENGSHEIRRRQGRAAVDPPGHVARLPGVEHDHIEAGARECTLDQTRPGSIRVALGVESQQTRLRRRVDTVDPGRKDQAREGPRTYERCRRSGGCCSGLRDWCTRRGGQCKPPRRPRRPRGSSPAKSCSRTLALPACELGHAALTA